MGQPIVAINRGAPLTALGRCVAQGAEGVAPGASHGFGRTGGACVVVAFALATSPARAEQRETVIHVVYVNEFARVRPNPWSGSSREELTIVLSGKNDLREEHTDSGSRFSVPPSFNSKLGGDALAPNSGYAVRWHVLSATSLQRTVDFPQSTRIDLIEIDGAQCRAKWEQRLKPGFTEYYLYSSFWGGYSFYISAHMVSSTCEIEMR